jgi:hypothetical protein
VWARTTLLQHISGVVLAMAIQGQVGLHPSNLDAALYFVRGIARDAEQ